LVQPSLPPSVQSAAASALQTAQAQQVVQSVQVPAAPTSMPVVFEVALGMLALGVVGGIALLVLE
jgi:hypothetical protein